MLQQTIRKAAAKMLGATVLAVALATLAFTADASAQSRVRTWSIAVYIQYIDGTVYENVVLSGVPTQDLPAILQECNSSHAWGAAVRFHCYPIPE